MSFSEAENEKPPTTTKTTPTVVSKPSVSLVQASNLNKTPTGATSLISRPVSDNTNAGATTLMVLTTSSVASANQNGAVGVMSSGSNSGTLAVKTAASSGNLGGAKTIVVMPVSNNFSGGDGSAAKRFKIE